MALDTNESDNEEIDIELINIKLGLRNFQCLLNIN